MKSRTTWFVLMDGFNLKVYEAAGLDSKPTLVHEATSPVQSMAERDLSADGPGRTHDSHGTGRHAMEPHTHPRDTEKANFIQDALDWLNDSEQQGGCDSLVFVAPPKVLGTIREKLPTDLKDKVVDEVPKDLINSPVKAIESAIATMKHA